MLPVSLHRAARATALPPLQQQRGRAPLLLRPCRSAVRTHRAGWRLAVQGSADSPNLLAKLGRVLKEKAQADIDRIFQARATAVVARCRRCDVQLTRRTRTLPVRSKAPARRAKS